MASQLVLLASAPATSSVYPLAGSQNTQCVRGVAKVGIDPYKNVLGSVSSSGRTAVFANSRPTLHGSSRGLSLGATEDRSCRVGDTHKTCQGLPFHWRDVEVWREGASGAT
ncbi:hypothetical protein TNCV_3732551 [Trichonephila clavipes]|nr:hypothetical protein TNCV_3732551 [Trichonephila clavipes]